MTYAAHVQRLVTSNPGSCVHEQASGSYPGMLKHSCNTISMQQSAACMPNTGFLKRTGQFVSATPDAYWPVC